MSGLLLGMVLSVWNCWFHSMVTLPPWPVSTDFGTCSYQCFCQIVPLLLLLLLLLLFPPSSLKNRACIPHTGHIELQSSALSPCL
jgi:hypothetical protein